MSILILALPRTVVNDGHGNKKIVQHCMIPLAVFIGVSIIFIILTLIIGNKINKVIVKYDDKNTVLKELLVFGFPRDIEYHHDIEISDDINNIILNYIPDEEKPATNRKFVC